MRLFPLILVFSAAVWIANSSRCKRIAACYCPSSKEMRCAGHLPINIDMLRKAASIYHLWILDVRGRVFSIFFIGQVLQACPFIKEIRAEDCDCDTVRDYIGTEGVRITHSCGDITQRPENTSYPITEIDENNTSDWFWWFTDPPEERDLSTWAPAVTSEETTSDEWTTQTTTSWYSSSTSSRSTTRRRRGSVSPGTALVPHSASVGPTPAFNGRFPLSYTDFLIIAGFIVSSAVSLFFIVIYIRWRQGYFNPPQNEEEELLHRSSICYCLRRCMRAILPTRQIGNDEYERLEMQGRDDVQAANEPHGDGGHGDNVEGRELHGSFESIDIEDIGQASGGEPLETDRSYFRRRSPRQQDAGGSVDKKQDNARKAKFLAFIKKIRESVPRVTLEELRELSRRKLPGDVRITSNPLEGVDFEFDELSLSPCGAEGAQKEQPITEGEGVQAVMDTISFQELLASIKEGDTADTFSIGDTSSASSVEVFNVQKQIAAMKREDCLRSVNEKAGVHANTPRETHQVNTLPEEEGFKPSDFTYKPDPLEELRSLEDTWSPKLVLREPSTESHTSDTPPISIFFPEETELSPASQNPSMVGDMSAIMTGMSVSDISYMSNVTVTVSEQVGSASDISSCLHTPELARKFRPSSAPASISTSQEDTDEDSYTVKTSKLTHSIS